MYINMFINYKYSSLSTLASPKKRGKKKMPTLNGKIVVCPKCTSKDVAEVKSWILKGGIRNNVFRIHLYECDGCGKSFRKAEPLETV
jgi:hypothetical protein